MPDKKPAVDWDKLVKDIEAEQAAQSVALGPDQNMPDEIRLQHELEALTKQLANEKSQAQKNKEAITNWLGMKNDEARDRVLNAGMAAFPTGLALMAGGAPAAAGGAVAARTGLSRFTEPLLNFLGSRKVAGGMTLLQALGGFMEDPNDHGQAARAMTDLGFRALDSVGPMKKFTALSPNMSKEFANFLYNYAQNKISNTVGQKFEGNREIHNDQFSAGEAAGSITGALLRFAGAQSAKTAAKLPQMVNPGLQTKLMEQIPGLEKMSPDDAAAMTKRLHDLANSGLVEQNVPAALTGRKRLNFREQMGTRLAELNAMPANNADEVVAKQAAADRLVADWRKMTDPDVAAHAKAIKDLRIGDVDKELEDMLDPAWQWNKARLAAQTGQEGSAGYLNLQSNGKYAVDKKRGGASSVPIITDMTSPNLLKMRAALKANTGEADFIGNKSSYTWLNSVKESEMARTKMKEALLNSPDYVPGTNSKEAQEFIKVVNSPKSAGDFVQEFSTPTNIANFNKFVTDLQTREWGRRQYITYLSDQLNAGSKESSSRVFKNVMDQSESEIDALMGKGSYAGLKEIAEASEKAQQWYGRKVTGGGKPINLLFPAIFLGYQVAKGMDADADQTSALAYGIGGAAAFAGNKLILTPKRIDALLADNGRYAKLLNRMWDDPVKYQHYGKLIGRMFSFIDKSSPDSDIGKPDQ